MGQRFRAVVFMGERDAGEGTRGQTGRREEGRESPKSRETCERQMVGDKKGGCWS